MTIRITSETDVKAKQYIEDGMYKFNLAHFPKDLGGRYEEINLYLKDDQGQVRGGIISEVCWNWLEIIYLMIDEELRGTGYGTELLVEVEKIALEKNVIL